MTKRERAQVVELLRCAADTGSGVMITSFEFDLSERVIWLAYEASGAPAGHWCDRPRILLEAAQRVEEGTWP